MKVLNLVWKSTVVVTSLVSLFAFAESYYDQKFYSVSFVEDQNFQLTIDENSDYKRNVASQQVLKTYPAVKIVNFDKKELVNGKWEITRYLNEKGEVEYDKLNNPEDKNGYSEAQFELIELSTVRINNDNEQTFKISILTDEGRIALFKPYGAGYEIIEARKVKETEEKVEIAESVNEVEKEEVELKKDPVDKFNIEGELILNTALDIKKSRSVLRGSNNLSGSASLNNGVLTIDFVELHKGTKNENGIDGITLTLGDNGQFGEFGEVTGIVSVINGNEMKVTFSTGPLSNAILNFVTYDRKQVLDEQKRELEERRALREEEDRDNNIEKSEGYREVANDYQSKTQFKKASFDFNAE